MIRNKVIGIRIPSLCKTLNYEIKRPKGILSNIIDTVKKEASKDEELQASLKKFEDNLSDVKQSKTLRSIKSTLSYAKKEIIEQNKAAFTDLREKLNKVQDKTSYASGKVVETISTVTEPVRKIGRKFRPTTNISVEKIRDSSVVSHLSKNIKRVQETIVDDSESFRYGGFMSREKREEIRLEKLEKAKEDQEKLKMAEDPNAGSNIVIHKESIWRQKWSEFKDGNPLIKGAFEMKRAYDESNNVFVYYLRSITNTISDTFQSMFQESETAQVIKEITQIDPNFNMEKFMKDAREYIIPEILEAFLKADFVTLHSWCGEAVYNLLKSTLEAAKKPGLRLDGKILDLRSVDLVAAKIIGDYPVLVLTFHTQQISYLKDATGNIASGKEDDIEAMFYIWALAKHPEPDPLTGGWKLIEMASRPANQGW